jgi:hypothetical protein
MKTKVIAFRVTQQEYDALVYGARQSQMKLSDFVNTCLSNPIQEGIAEVRKEEKRLEAKAKRDAKKAAANGAQ